ncbi:MAG: ribosome rescue protein RqcH [Nitrosopumilaceae archaeon]
MLPPSSKSIILDKSHIGVTLSGIELRYLVNEISKKTSDYYVSNIYGITKNALLFKLHHPENPDVMLMVSTSGIWISSVKIDQIEPNRILKRLRSDLLRLKLSKIEQIEAERIVYLTFSGFDKEFTLVGEFFGDGNIILCNKEMKILALLHSIDVRHRQLRVGLSYTPPPQKGLNVFDVSEKDFVEIKTSNLSAANWIGRTFGLPKRFAEEIFYISKIDPKVKGNTLNDNNVKKIFESMKKLIEDIVSGNHNPVIIKNDSAIEISPIKLENVENSTKVESFIEGLDTVFSQSIVDAGKDIQSSNMDKKIQDLEVRFDEQSKAIKQVKEKSQKISSVAKSLSEMTSQGIMSIGDPIAVSNLSKLNSQLTKEKGISFLKIGDEKVKIDVKASLPSIASTLFNEAKKQSSAITSIEKQITKTENEIKKLKNQSQKVKDSVTYSEIRKKNWFERYRWFYTSDGFLAIGGRDSSSNSAIIRKHLEKNDKVFHAEIFGSPFFILKNSDAATTASINEVANATVCFSRAWREAMYGMNAYWVEPEQVKKAAPSGQYLPKGSFTIDGQRNFVKISSLKLAVGLLKQNESFLITCGPVDPIKKKCECYSIIEPSGSESSDVAKKIRTEFIKMKGEVIKNISLDEFVRVLPAGSSHVIESGLGNVRE